MTISPKKITNYQKRFEEIQQAATTIRQLHKKETGVPLSLLHKVMAEARELLREMEELKKSYKL